MATFVVRLLLLLSFVPTVDLQAVSGIDLERFNATIDGAKAKFSSVKYFYLDDPSPSDYYDNITTAARILKDIFNESTTLGEMQHVILAFADFFKYASSRTVNQATPFGWHECRLLPQQFRNCRIKPRISEIMDVIENTLRHTGVAWEDHFAALHRALNRKCETFGIDALFKMTTTLVGEHCEEGHSDGGSMEQDMQRRMMQYAKENAFDGENENKHVE